MSILTKRLSYKPFEYPKFYDLSRVQQSVHWLHDDIQLGSDIQDWNNSLTENEKSVIGNTLKTFTQAEVLVGDYWRKIADVFPKPEICMMASTFSYFETIHQAAYAKLNEELGLDNFQEFLNDEETMKKFEFLTSFEPKDFDYSNLEHIKNLLRSIAVFSAFTEGVSIFSSFAILLSFQKQDLMKGVGQIVSYSIRDENIHSKGGILLFHELTKEYPGLKKELLPDIYDAAMLVYKMEAIIIDQIFEYDDKIRTITKEELKNFIKYRINNKLLELYPDFPTPRFTIDSKLLSNLEWFDALSSGKEFGDFFATHITEYSNVNFSEDDYF